METGNLNGMFVFQTTVYDFQKFLKNNKLISKMSYQDGAPTKYVTQPSASLKCPVCDDLFQNPVISTKCGHTFCLACVSENACDSPAHCPLDQTSFLSTDVVANRAVQGQLEDMEIFCRHGLIRFGTDTFHSFSSFFKKLNIVSLYCC